MKANLFISACTVTATAIMLLAGCHTTKNTRHTECASAQNTKTEQAEPFSSEYTAKEDNFAYALLSQSVQEEGNTFISPACAAMALDMLTPGADGQTKTELETVVPPIRIANSDQLKTASAIWLNEGFKALPAYLNANKSAEIYSGKITAKKVNRWAADKTNGKITKVLQDPVDYCMVLTSALYFKALWQLPFKAHATAEEVFYGSQKEHQVAMMHQTARLQYTENEHLQAVRLDYTSPYCMDIFLPREGQSISSIVEDIPAIRLGEEDGKKVRLTLPKVKMEYEKQLNDYLKAMGLKTCFTGQADFSLLSQTPVMVDMVKQNTYLAIDEEGTEAAAVTTVAMAMMARPQEEQIYEMTINRPFLLLIRETESNRILFYGVIKNL